MKPAQVNTREQAVKEARGVLRAAGYAIRERGRASSPEGRYPEPA